MALANPFFDGVLEECRSHRAEIARMERALQEAGPAEWRDLASFDLLSAAYRALPDVREHHSSDSEAHWLRERLREQIRMNTYEIENLTRRIEFSGVRARDFRPHQVVFYVESLGRLHPLSY